MWISFHGPTQLSVSENLPWERGWLLGEKTRLSTEIWQTPFTSNRISENKIINKKYLPSSFLEILGLFSDFVAGFSLEGCKIG